MKLNSAHLFGFLSAFIAVLTDWSPSTESFLKIGSLNDRDSELLRSDRAGLTHGESLTRYFFSNISSDPRDLLKDGHIEKQNQPYEQSICNLQTPVNLQKMQVLCEMAQRLFMTHRKLLFLALPMIPLVKTWPVKEVPHHNSHAACIVFMERIRMLLSIWHFTTRGKGTILSPNKECSHIIVKRING